MLSSLVVNCWQHLLPPLRWALYAEQLADELGAFENDAVGRLGYLQSMKAFNDILLVGGNVPLDVLAQSVDRYIENGGETGSKTAGKAGDHIAR